MPPPTAKNRTALFGDTTAGWAVTGVLIGLSELFLLLWLAGLVGNRLDCSRCNWKNKT